MLIILLFDVKPVENARDDNLSVIDGSSLPFVDVSDVSFT